MTDHPYRSVQSLFELFNPSLQGAPISSNATATSAASSEQEGSKDPKRIETCKVV